MLTIIIKYSDANCQKVKKQYDTINHCYCKEAIKNQGKRAQHGTNFYNNYRN